MFVNVPSILKHEHRSPSYVSPDITAYDAINVMASSEAGTVFVLNHGHLEGVFSPKDYGLRVALHGSVGKQVRIDQVMTRSVVTVQRSEAISHCMQIMLENRIHYLPVVELDTVLGVLTMGDILKALVSGHEFVIDHLEGYARH